MTVTQADRDAAITMLGNLIVPATSPAVVSVAIHFAAHRLAERARIVADIRQLSDGWMNNGLVTDRARYYRELAAAIDYDPAG